MERKAILEIMFTLVLFVMLTSTVHIQPVKASPRTWTVDDDGPADFNTIQGAINAASPQDAIYVLNGTYDENVVIRKTLSLLGQNATNAIIDGSGNQWTVEVYANNVTISGFTIRNGGKNMPYGIIPNGGIRLSCNGSLISNNIIKNNDYSGVWLGYWFSAPCYSNVIENNLILNNGGYAISIMYPSNNNSLLKNNVSKNGYGIHIDSGSTLLRGNAVDDNKYNFGIYGDFESQDIDTSNTVNGRPVYYWIAEKNKAIPTDAGAVYIVNSMDVTIKDMNLTNLEHGVVLVNAKDSFVENITISSNWWNGIWLLNSDDNKISHSKIVSNVNGLFMQNSNSNIIDGNNILNNQEALFFQNSNNNVVARNQLSNLQGIYLERSSQNIFYHNNMNDTYYKVNSFESNNTWDNGYPSGGNYWSDYDERYPNATELDDSGTWDTPYVIDENNLDNYPLTEPWTPASSLPTTIQELKTKIEEFWSQGEIDNQGIARSLMSKLNAAEKLVDGGKIDRARTVLEAFISQIQNLSRMHITLEAAEVLVKSAEQMILHL